MPGPNFLLGAGERMMEEISPSGRDMEKRWSYDFPTARTRLTPMVVSASAAFDTLPDEACPHDETVAVFTLHPEALAKSYYPGGILRALDLETVGSRPLLVQPEKWTRRGEPEPVPSTELFVAGPRSTFRNWAEALPEWTADTEGAPDLPKLEQVRAFEPDRRLRGLEGAPDEVLLEVVLHARPSMNYVLEAFEAYALEHDAQPQLDKRMYAGGLCFMPVKAASARLVDFAKFSFLRVARPMPALRPMEPVLRTTSTEHEPFAVELPEEEPVDPQLHIAVLDGGLPEDSGLEKWATAHDADGVGEPVEEYLSHGFSVTSALLFGPLQDGATAERPYASVVHFRVLDSDSGTNGDPGEEPNLYDVLHRISDILQGHQFDFVNLSIGPALPIEDDEVHGWTSILDEILSSGSTLATVAVGNGGERDSALQFDRIQVPSDCVNAMGIGAANSAGPTWGRASYSSVGPGRSPGIVKPDVVAFGGTEEEPFWALGLEAPGWSTPEMGTSFASPATLRLGAGIRAHFGDLLNPLAIRALLVHCSEPAELDRKHIGWGRVRGSLEDYVVCPDGTARVVYQGELAPAQWIRARIPLPEEQLSGYVTIGATFCYATNTDPDHPGSYTRSGLEIVFRPHAEKFDPKSENPKHPKPGAFFQLKEFSTEKELRRDAHKWETTLHRIKRFRGTTLKEPMFDIHYNARELGAPAQSGENIPYALIITVQSSNTDDLYDRIVRRYPTQIRPLRPVVQIPIRS